MPAKKAKPAKKVPAKKSVKVPAKKETKGAKNARLAADALHRGSAKKINAKADKLAAANLLPGERVSEAAMRLAQPILDQAPEKAARNARIVELRKSGLGYVAIGLDPDVKLSDSAVMRILRTVAPDLTGRKPKADAPVAATA